MTEPFHVSRKTPKYGKEMKQAERFLAEAEGDLGLVLKTLDLLYTHKKWKFKGYTSMTYMVHDFPVALVLAQTVLAKENETQALASKVFQQVLEKEDIFG